MQNCLRFPYSRTLTLCVSWQKHCFWNRSPSELIFGSSDLAYFIYALILGADPCALCGSVNSLKG